MTLPKGWTVAAPPAAAQVAAPAGSVAVSVERTADGASVTVRRTLSIGQHIVPARDAARLRELLAAWASPASRDLLLRPPKP